ncbi:MAG: Gfo/Idh/MocA family oxidoreductase [Planctomycetota bacterium]|nr:Gfo/Idh/MocA family oxidoreductase [Planctomycetota bacterium]
MKRGNHTPHHTRRALLKSALAASASAWIVPAHVLGSAAQTPPSGRITLGVIGVGAQGQNDMRDLLTHEGVRVTAICDVNRRNIDAARQHIAAAYGKPDVKVFADFRELNADPSIDAVLMALPVHWHSIPALDAILHGKHIYHEKPMAMSFEEARRVREAVRRKKVVFQFGTQQRSDLKFRWACELALNGRLGKLREIQVSAPGGGQRPPFPAQPVPDYVNWDHWVGPAPMTPFHEEKIDRANHENISNFSLGMISCWGIHHLDIAQWGNGTDDTGPSTIEGEGIFPKEGGFDAIVRWKVRFEYAQATPVTFVSDGTPGFRHGVRFVGESAWVHVERGQIQAGDEQLLRDPQNKCDTMPITLPVSNRHTYNFVEAIQKRTRAICDIETAVRSDALCQLALIAVKQGRNLQWDPKAERFIGDDAANPMLQPRTFRGDWKLPEV